MGAVLKCYAIERHFKGKRYQVSPKWFSRSETRELEAFEADKKMILENKSESHEWIEKLKKAGQITELTRSAVAILIDKVIVYSADRVEIRYRFESAFETMKKYVDAYSQKNHSESEAV